jgi:FlaA1/EpsC-like NDP-sugar epimerase
VSRALNPRTLFALFHDVLASVVAWLVAYWLRFNLHIPDEFLHSALTHLLWVVPVQALTFWRLGLYRGIWRFASLNDLKRIVLACLTTTLFIALVLVMVKPSPVVPRSVLLLYPILLVLLMGGNRLVYRAWKEHRMSLSLLSRREPLLVLGAGSAAEGLIRELSRSTEWRAVGLLDDAPRKQGRDIHGFPVLGPIDSVKKHAEALGVTHVVIAMPGATHTARKRATELCNAAGLNVLTVPAIADLVSGRVSVSNLRKIELDDLLGRDQVKLDESGLTQLIHDQTVLVTGSGGSIGSELARQLVRFLPARLVLLDHSEFALYQIEQEFVRSHAGIDCRFVIADVKDAALMKEVMQTYQPAIVFHAAAYKHVPLMEQENAWQAARNNIMGTLISARAAQTHGAKKFVLISTDKAVNPTNVMGATKRVAEQVCQALQNGVTQFVSVRFGNVLGSSGSVIPKFQQQIAAGGPLTVTHPEITRYFMSIPEACQLVLQAGLMGKGGEIFVLDMGEPVRIADLARQMIRLSGHTENEIPIEYTGLRPGEKLYEELLADEESTLPTPHPKLRVAQARKASGELIRELEDWFTVELKPEKAVKESLKKWVPEYELQNKVS